MVVKNLSPELITRGLKTNCIGRKIIYLPSIASTMDIARLEALKGAVEGTVIIAGEQTGGRGRLKRTWLAPKGNIALSIVLYPDVASLPYLIMIASLAVVKSIESVTGIKGQIKWPNDILINGKKVSGILIENEVRGNKVGYSILGIGINVTLKANDSADIANTATSLKRESGVKGIYVKLIRKLFQEFDGLYVKLPEGKAIYEAWRDRLVTLGKPVKAQSGRQIIKGIAESVNEDGVLLIREEDGSLIKVEAGDVTLRDK
jgi:BirA family biotin operon repressor/biotin-[acetyl-CoA-carboxylase] ligase